MVRISCAFTVGHYSWSFNQNKSKVENTSVVIKFVSKQSVCHQSEQLSCKVHLFLDEYHLFWQREHSSLAEGLV